ncbi:polymer-forming cytoskeletal protein [Fredinandcohnia sp. QZ13]|uniref:polymer-forming cytoskeletal protein n=1 Tax=Fredinandcohnia sp. QZ13 TaxID=3073144 RepID=UPI0028532CC5|nr:polymer-forming cytoskeletal protein [Fredinandcohnia sp. QZ13]MDR4887608.1 polymer-forming cytoskeletal protein [Fredinandcohnia sp. QZ13]
MVNLENQGNLIINGMGSSGGGSFNKVLINGKGNVQGDIECNDFTINGTGTVAGNVKGNEGKISGNGNIEGSIEFEQFIIEGAGGIQGDAKINNMKISGNGKIGGSLKAEEIKLRGKATIAEDCEAEEFKGTGDFVIGGLLNADVIDISIAGECHAKEIGGRTIKVKKGIFSFLNNLFKAVYPVSLTTEIIEADEIEIEYTNAKMVRGDNITIGPNCHIDVVEYKGTFSQDPSATVVEAKQI